METNYTLLLGFIPGMFFLAMLFFSSIGVAIALLIDATKRDQNSKDTPVKFNGWFLIKDNWKPIVQTFLAILVSLRCAGSLFPEQFTDSDLASPMGKEKWLFGSLLIGLLYNSLLQYIKQKADILKTKRK